MTISFRRGFLVLVLAWCVLGGPRSRLVDRAPVDPRCPSALDLRKAPLAFEKNVGQADPSVRYLARCKGYDLYLMPTRALWVLAPAPRQGRTGPSAASLEKPFCVGMELKGADPLCRAEGLEWLQGESHYLMGRDPARWKTHVPHYARVKFTNIYPKIDLVYYGQPGKLEYDLVVRPGGDPKDIRLAFEGISRMDRRPDGNLDLHAGKESFELCLPEVYQEDLQGRRALRGRFVVRGKEAGFEVGGYDPTRSLVIDPTFSLAYSTYLGGDSPSFYGSLGMGVTVDAGGNAYVVGMTTSLFFPTTSGAFQTTQAGPLYDVFVSKINPNGTGLVYSTYLGGSGNDQGADIALDSAGNAYVTGLTESPDFPVTPGAFQGTFGGGEDAFVTKLNPTGTALVYSSFLGGSNYDEGAAIAVDGAGNAYVSGLTGSNNFPVVTGSYQTTYAGGTGDAFVAKLNPLGSALIYSTYLGGSGREPNGDLDLAIDGAGNAFIASETDSTDLPVTPGAFQTGYQGGTEDGFAAKLDSAGKTLAYCTYLGGSGIDYLDGIALDGAGNAYITGESQAGFPTTAGAYQTTNSGGFDAIVTKLNPLGTGLVFSTYIGGGNSDGGESIALDGAGNVDVGGGTSSTDFPVTSDGFQTTYGGNGTFFGDAFFAQLSPSGSSLAYSTYLGGSDSDGGSSRIALGSDGSVYIVGMTYSGDFPTTAGAFQSAQNEPTNSFVSKFIAATAIPTSTPTATMIFTSTPTFTPTCVVHVWPDPFDPRYAHDRKLKIGCVPPGGEVFIYTLSGELVAQLPEAALMATWGGLNQKGAQASVGIYYYVIQVGSKVLDRGKFLKVR